MTTTDHLHLVELPHGRTMLCASAAPDWHAAAARVGGVFSETRIGKQRLVRVSCAGMEFVATWVRPAARESAIRDVLERAARWRLNETQRLSARLSGEG